MEWKTTIVQTNLPILACLHNNSLCLAMSIMISGRISLETNEGFLALGLLLDGVLVYVPSIFFFLMYFDYLLLGNSLLPYC